MSMESLIESRIGPGLLSTLKETLRAVGKDLQAYLLPDAVVLVNARGDDLCLSNEEANTTDDEQPTGNASPCDFSGWNKGKQTWSIAKMVGEQELFIWHVIRPMEQITRNTCLLVSAVMCVEGLHRRAYEAQHGLGTFPLNAKSPKDLMKECFYDYDAVKDERLWNFDGVMPKKIGQVFEKIKKDGVPTANSDRHLKISGFKVHE